MAIISKVDAFPSLNLLNPALHPPPLTKSLISYRPMSLKTDVRVFVGAKSNFSSLRGGTGILERPTFDQSQFVPTPEAQEGGDIGRMSNKKRRGSGDSYKVLLIEDARHTEKLVEKALPQVVPSVTASDARRLFHESRQNGVAVVIVTVKEHAEFYAQMMMRSGLRSAIEPDSDMA